MSGVSGSPRIGVVGTCQVVGIGATFQKIWPGAEVKTWHMKPTCPDSAESIAEQLAECDLAVSQVRIVDPAAPLAFARLRETAKRAVFLPVVVFNGFQPDCIYLVVGGTPVVGPFALLHSAIIAGGFALGLPQARVARLFNALTYASLGYFEAFGIARDLLTASFRHAGHDLAPVLDRCLAREGTFMHTGNHPRISILTALAHMAAVQAGMVDGETGAPEDVEDFLAHSFQWPVYPELARRLALPKSDLVVKMPSRALERAPAHRRKVPDMVGAFYALYAQLDQAAFRAAVPARVLAGLEEILGK